MQINSPDIQIDGIIARNGAGIRIQLGPAASGVSVFFAILSPNFLVHFNFAAVGGAAWKRVARIELEVHIPSRAVSVAKNLEIIAKTWVQIIELITLAEVKQIANQGRLGEARVSVARAEWLRFEVPDIGKPNS